MKITINGKEHNWYIADLDCYTDEFLKEIIFSLFYTHDTSLDKSHMPHVDKELKISESDIPLNKACPDNNNLIKNAVLEKDYGCNCGGIEKEGWSHESWCKAKQKSAEFGGSL
jgi:hypothetical protein